jgi:cbb3-type cytochrome oxidase maturation protein
MLIGLVISFFVFLWALNNGQFKDQKRARFLPLKGEEESRPRHLPRMSRLEVYALALLATTGLMACAAVLAFALLRAG